MTSCRYKDERVGKRIGIVVRGKAGDKRTRLAAARAADNEFNVSHSAIVRNFATRLRANHPYTMSMTFLEATVLITRWAHVLATVVWIGGNIFYLTTLRPAMRQSRSASPDLPRHLGERFKQAVDLSMWTLIITGVLLLYDRLTQEIGLAYAIILGVKLILSAAMFLIALSLSRRGQRRRSSPVEGLWAEILPAPLARLATGAGATASRLASPTNALFLIGPAVILLGLLLRQI